MMSDLWWEGVKHYNLIPLRFYCHPLMGVLIGGLFAYGFAHFMLYMLVDMVRHPESWD
jgi:hypothetical protein